MKEHYLKFSSPVNLFTIIGGLLFINSFVFVIMGYLQEPQVINGVAVISPRSLKFFFIAIITGLLSLNLMVAGLFVYFNKN